MRPTNLLLIMSDEHNPRILGSAGHRLVQTPNLDRLAAQGIEPERPPYTVREGGSRICFIQDPDGYRIELIERG